MEKSRPEETIPLTSDGIESGYDTQPSPEVEDKAIVLPSSSSRKKHPIRKRKNKAVD